METTVYFATNRVLDGSPGRWQSYGEKIVAPADPTAVTYGTALVSPANLTADTVSSIWSIRDLKRGGFSRTAIDDLCAGSRNLQVFIHGFANSFENAITRATFNREWFSQSGLSAAETTIIAFSWPSQGAPITLPISLKDYRKDQTNAGQSGLHIMIFLANLLPILTRSRANGCATFLLVHGMGVWALQAAIESWFIHGNGDVDLFDEAFLLAPDETDNTFNYPPHGRLSELRRLAKRVSIYVSKNDEVLRFGGASDRIRRLGRHGLSLAKHRSPAKYRVVDASGFRDYFVDVASSHEYYRRSPGVRADIVQTMEYAAQGLTSDTQLTNEEFTRFRADKVLSTFTNNVLSQFGEGVQDIASGSQMQASQLEKERCDIFVSYAHEDQDRVRLLVKALRDESWKVFWDVDIPPGAIWDEHIGVRLDGASIVVVVWSKQSILSQPVRSEARRAAKHGTILPLAIDAIELPLNFDGYQTTDLTEWKKGPLPDHLSLFIRGRLSDQPTGRASGSHRT